MCLAGCNDPDKPSDSGATLPCKKCAITSETVSTARTNRARTRVGVGERVVLTVNPGGGTWTITGAGTLNSKSGTSVTLTAGDRVGKASIEAKAGGCTCTIEFEVVEPSGAYQKQDGATIHHPGKCNAGFRGVTHLIPKDVSFEYIEVNEGEVDSSATGSFKDAGWDKLKHPMWSSWATVGGGSDAKGSLVEGPNHDGGVYYDFIHSGDLPAGCRAGEFDWNIPWLFRVSGGTEKRFTRLLHHAVADGKRKMTISKGGVTVSATEP